MYTYAVIISRERLRLKGRLRSGGLWEELFFFWKQALVLRLLNLTELHQRLCVGGRARFCYPSVPLTSGLASVNSEGPVTLWVAWETPKFSLSRPHCLNTKADAQRSKHEEARLQWRPSLKPPPRKERPSTPANQINRTNSLKIESLSVNLCIKSPFKGNASDSSREGSGMCD